LKTSNKNLESWNERRSHNIVGTPGHVLLFEAVMNGKDRYALANNDSQRLLLVKISPHVIINHFQASKITNSFLFYIHLLYELIFSFLFWFRDLLRELDKNYEILLIIFFLDFLLFLVSEGLLFVYFFWTSFHSLPFSTLETWSGEGFCLPDPCELTFNNTLLLSNAAISFGN